MYYHAKFGHSKSKGVRGYMEAINLPMGALPQDMDNIM